MTMRQFLGERHSIDTLCHALYVRAMPAEITQPNGHIEPADIQWVSFPAPAELSNVARQAQTAHLDLLTAILRYPSLRYHFCRLVHLLEVVLATRPQLAEPTLPTWMASTNIDDDRLAEKRHRELIGRQKDMQKNPSPVHRAFRILFHPEKVLPVQLDSEKMSWVLEQLREVFHAVAVDKDVQEPLRKMLALLKTLPGTIAMTDPWVKRGPFSRTNGRVNGKGTNGSGNGGANSPATTTTTAASSAPTMKASMMATATTLLGTATKTASDPLRQVFPHWDMLIQEVENIILGAENDDTFKFYASVLFRFLEKSMTDPAFTDLDDYPQACGYALNNVLRLLWLPRYQGPVTRLMRSLVAVADQLWLNGGRTEASLAFENGLMAMIHTLKQQPQPQPQPQQIVTTDSTTTSTSRSLNNLIALIEEAISRARLTEDPIPLPSIDWKEDTGDDRASPELRLDNICLEFPEAHAQGMRVTSQLEHSADLPPGARRWNLGIHGLQVEAKDIQFFYQNKNMFGHLSRDLGQCHLRIPSGSLDINLVMVLDTLPDLNLDLISALRKDRAHIWDHHPPPPPNTTAQVSVKARQSANGLLNGNGNGHVGMMVNHQARSELAPLAFSVNNGGDNLDDLSQTSAAAAAPATGYKMPPQQHKSEMRTNGQLATVQGGHWMSMLLQQLFGDRLAATVATTTTAAAATKAAAENSPLQQLTEPPILFHPFRTTHFQPKPALHLPSKNGTGYGNGFSNGYENGYDNGYENGYSNGNGSHNNKGGGVSKTARRRGSTYSRVTTNGYGAVRPTHTMAVYRQGTIEGTTMADPVRSSSNGKKNGHGGNGGNGGGHGVGYLVCGPGATATETQGRQQWAMPWDLESPSEPPLLSPTTTPTPFTTTATTTVTTSPLTTTTTIAANPSPTAKATATTITALLPQPSPLDALLLQPQSSPSSSPSLTLSSSPPCLFKLESCSVRIHRLDLTQVTASQQQQQQHRPLRNNRLEHALLERRLRALLQTHLHRSVLALVALLHTGLADLVQAAQGLD
ncbi:hypothetical protein DFQ27_009147 [Actinomortierella ambigua]|uniref:Uncharacterized protein n=1 Tax=Actinomortierella ambigua TaxID=1343610 RepID=A0A9P6QJC7_9FUNG|nr:hypothetical protein DFQ27_009147 [Actinomortierella ambigua]